MMRSKTRARLLATALTTFFVYMHPKVSRRSNSQILGAQPSKFSENFGNGGGFYDEEKRTLDGLKKEALRGQGFNYEAYTKLGPTVYRLLRGSGEFCVNETSISRHFAGLPDNVCALIKIYPEIGLVVQRVQTSLEEAVRAGDFKLADVRQKQLDLIFKDLANEFRLRLRAPNEFPPAKTPAISGLIKAMMEARVPPGGAVEASTYLFKQACAKTLQDIAGPPRVENGYLFTPLPPSGIYRTPYLGVIPRLPNTSTGDPQLDSLKWPHEILDEHNITSGSEGPSLLVVGAQIPRPRGYWLRRYEKIYNFSIGGLEGQAIA